MLPLLVLGAMAAGFALVVRRVTALAWLDAPPPVDPAALPADDRPPASAVGWPPADGRFVGYVAGGLEEIEVFLARRDKLGS